MTEYRRFIDFPPVHQKDAAYSYSEFIIAVDALRQGRVLEADFSILRRFLNTMMNPLNYHWCGSWKMRQPQKILKYITKYWSPEQIKSAIGLWGIRDPTIYEGYYDSVERAILCENVDGLRSAFAETQEWFLIRYFFDAVLTFNKPLVNGLFHWLVTGGHFQRVVYDLQLYTTAVYETEACENLADSWIMELFNSAIEDPESDYQRTSLTLLHESLLEMSTYLKFTATNKRARYVYKCCKRFGRLLGCKKQFMKVVSRYRDLADSVLG